MMHASIFTRVRPPARHSLLSSHLVHALTHVRANRRSPDPPIRARRQTSERPARARSPSIRSLDGGRATRVPHLLFLPIPHAHSQRLRLGERASLTALRASRKKPAPIHRARPSSVASSESSRRRRRRNRNRIDRSRANRPIASPSRRLAHPHEVTPTDTHRFHRPRPLSRLDSSSSRRRRRVRSVVACRSPARGRRVVVVRDRLRASSRLSRWTIHRIDRLASFSSRVSPRRRRRRRARVDVCRMRRFEFRRRDASGTRPGRDANDDRARRRRRRGEARRGARRFGSYFIGTRV